MPESGRPFRGPSSWNSADIVLFCLFRVMWLLLLNLFSSIVNNAFKLQHVAIIALMVLAIGLDRVAVKLVGPDLAAIRFSSSHSLLYNIVVY